MARSASLIVPALGAAVLLAACDAYSKVSDDSSARKADAAVSETRVSLAMATPSTEVTAAQGTGDAAGCTPIQFERGTSSATVAGSVPPEDPRSAAPQPACYTLAVGEGQQAKVRLLSGENVGITIPGVGDMRDSFEFRTKRGTYKLELYQLFPNAQAAPFRLHAEVSSASSARGNPGTAGAQGASGDGKLVGAWGLNSECRSDGGITYKADGTYNTFADYGRWELKGDRLTEVSTGLNEAGDPASIDVGKPIVSRIAWKGPDEIVVTAPDGKRWTYGRCP